MGLIEQASRERQRPEVFQSPPKRNTMCQSSDQNRPAEGGSHPIDERVSRRSTLQAGIAAGASLVIGAGRSKARRGPTRGRPPCRTRPWSLTGRTRPWSSSTRRTMS